MTRVVLSSRELIWGGGEVFLHDVGVALTTLGHQVVHRVHPASELARRVPGSLVSRRRPVRRALVVANDFRSLWQSILMDRAVRRVFVIHGDWQLSPVRVALIRRFRVRSFAVSTSVARTAARLGLADVPVLPLGPGPAVRHEGERRVPVDVGARPLCVGTVARDDSVKRLRLFTETVGAMGARGLLLTSSPEGTGAGTIPSGRPDITVLRGDTSTFWSEVDVFLSTSIAESLGMAHLESLAHGVPVLSTARGGPEDFLVGALAVGRLEDGAAGDLASRATAALVRMAEDWDGYWDDAQQALASRGPVPCARMMTQQ